MAARRGAVIGRADAEGVHLSQPALFSDILKLLDRKHRIKSVNMRQMNAVIEAANLIVEAFGRGHAPAIPNSGMVSWLQSDETGRSSLALAKVLAVAASLPNVPCVRQEDATAHPLDPADFGRCVGLLNAVPDLRLHLDAARSLSPVWSALIDVWGELESLLAEESPLGSCPRLGISP